MFLTVERCLQIQKKSFCKTESLKRSTFAITLSQVCMCVSRKIKGNYCLYDFKYDVKI